MKKHEQPAFPCMPLQDSLGRLMAPFPGFTKYEEVLLRIVCAKEANGIYNTLSDESLFRDAISMANLFFEKLEKIHESNATNIVEI